MLPEIKDELRDYYINRRNEIKKEITAIYQGNPVTRGGLKKYYPDSYISKVIDPFGVIENIAGLMVDKKFP